MKKIIRYNPAVTTFNMGDAIIFDSIEKQLSDVFLDAFNVDVSSHLPVSLLFSYLMKDADYKFVLGTNLLMGHLDKLFKQWDVNLFNAKMLGPAILIGVGWWQYNDKPDLYTKQIYKRILSHDVMHSVRDNYTKEMLKGMGFENVICTACPTMWSLTPEHCRDIPKTKADKVMTTLTDYSKDPEADIKMLELLKENYKEVYLWLQGIGDMDYLKELGYEDKVKLVPPSLKRYDDMLESGEIDYVGSRLHGGIRALQKKVRTLILGVDNRAKEKAKDFNINVISRDEADKIPEMVNSEFSTDIKIPLDEINRWKSQFLSV